MKVKSKTEMNKTAKQIVKEYNKRQGKVSKKITDDENELDYESDEELHDKYHNLKLYGGFVYKNFCAIVYNNFYIVTNVSMMV